MTVFSLAFAANSLSTTLRWGEVGFEPDFERFNYVRDKVQMDKAVVWNIVAYFGIGKGSCDPSG